MKRLTNYILQSKQIKLDSDGKENGFDYVDLGLPSGTMWATCNIGADKPEKPGLLFQFGRVDGYSYKDKNHKFFTSEENYASNGTAYVNVTTSGTKYKNDDILKLEDDAAHVNMGGKWIMPTKDDLQELYDTTTKQVTTINGKKGILFTSKVNGKSIFIMFSGYYYNGKFYAGGIFAHIRSSEAYDRYYSWNLDCSTYNSRCDVSYGARDNGYSIRGVFKK